MNRSGRRECQRGERPSRDGERSMRQHRACGSREGAGPCRCIMHHALAWMRNCKTVMEVVPCPRPWSCLLRAEVGWPRTLLPRRAVQRVCVCRSILPCPPVAPSPRPVSVVPAQFFRGSPWPADSMTAHSGWPGSLGQKRRSEGLKAGGTALALHHSPAALGLDGPNWPLKLCTV